MAITHVNNDAANQSASTSSLTITVGSTGAGHFLCVGAGWNSTSATIAVSGNGSGSFTSAVGPTNGTGIRGQIWYIQNCTGGDTTITLTVTGGPVGMQAYFMEFSGVASSGGTDGTNTSTGNGTALSTTITTTNANDLIIGYGNGDGTATPWTAGTGFTLSTATAQNRGMIEYEIVSSVQSGATVGLTSNATINWLMSTAAWKAAAAAGLVFEDDSFSQFQPTSELAVSVWC